MSNVKKNNRIGEVRINNFGSKMIIIGYRKSIDIDIYFPEYNWKTKADYSNFLKGSLKCPYEPRIYGIGFLGEGKYKTKENGKITKSYDHWRQMLRRCYDPYTINKQLTYANCFVCEEWHNFQNFAQWWEENYYEIEEERMCLDKDILIKDNKIYSPETCLIVPERINILFTKSDAKRGKCPIGVDWHKANNKFRARCSILNKENNKELIYLGLYNTSEEAFLAYKIFKEKYIKEIADEYKDLIPSKLYKSMYKYEIEIDD